MSLATAKEKTAEEHEEVVQEVTASLAAANKISTEANSISSVVRTGFILFIPVWVMHGNKYIFFLLQKKNIFVYLVKTDPIFGFPC